MGGNSKCFTRFEKHIKVNWLVTSGKVGCKISYIRKRLDKAQNWEYAIKNARKEFLEESRPWMTPRTPEMSSANTNERRRGQLVWNTDQIGN